MARKRKHVNGLLDPASNSGIAAITEHVVYTVLGDCEKCNTEKTIHAPYDLISKKYGTINVKSSTIHLSKPDNLLFWAFHKRERSKIPDYYICLGMDLDRTEIEHVWFFPGDSNHVKKYGIDIVYSYNGLIRVLDYEVDETEYNKTYQELNIENLREFRNITNNPTTLDKYLIDEVNSS